VPYASSDDATARDRLNNFGRVALDDHPRNVFPGKPATNDALDVASVCVAPTVAQALIPRCPMRGRPPAKVMAWHLLFYGYGLLPPSPHSDAPFFSHHGKKTCFFSLILFLGREHPRRICYHTGYRYR
jgi:hypothetical protein